MDSSYESVYERNWAKLPRELVGLILDRLVLLPDFIRFGAVCKPWSLVKQQECSSRRICYQEPPMLLIPSEDGNKDYRRLYSIWEDKIYPHRLQIPHRRRCCGSSYGWLAFAELKNDVSLEFSVTLLNPFSGTAIPLPTIAEIPFYEKDYDPEYYLIKVILSCDPCLYPDHWVAVVIVDVLIFYDERRVVYDERRVVAFIRSGEESWTHPCDNFSVVMDACFYQGKLYAVDDRFELVAIDFSQQQEGNYDSAVTKITMSIKSPHPVIDRYFVGSYLVEMERELLLVRKSFVKASAGDQTYFETTSGFKVRKFSQKHDSGNSAEWIDIEDLGKFSLFLGDNESVAIYASSNVANFQPNCIYYTDDCQEMNPFWPYEADDMGIYNLATGLISQHYTLEPSQKYLPAAVWISPKLGQTDL